MWGIVTKNSAFVVKSDHLAEVRAKSSAVSLGYNSLTLTNSRRNFQLLFDILISLNSFFTFYNSVDGDSSKPFDLLGTQDGSGGKKHIAPFLE